MIYGPGSSVTIPTELRAGRSGDRIPVGRDFPPVQTGPGVHPASCTMGTGSFPGVKYGRDVLLTTHPLLVPWSWKSRAIPLPTLWAITGPVTGTLYFSLLQLACHSVAVVVALVLTKHIKNYTRKYRHIFKFKHNPPEDDSVVITP